MSAIDIGAAAALVMVMVQTVTGAVSVDELGMTLPHEHIFNDLSEAFYPGIRSFSKDMAHAPGTPANARLLREDPYSSAENSGFDETDMDTVLAELGLYTGAGGRTIINSTTSAGRRPAASVGVAQRSGLQIVMSGG